MRKAAEFFADGGDNCAAEGFGDGIGVRKDGDDPADQAAGGGVHPGGQDRTDGDFLLEKPVIGPPGNPDADKEVKDMVVPLPELIDEKRLFPDGKVAVFCLPLPGSFAGKAEHLRRDPCQEAVEGAAVVGKKRMIIWPAGLLFTAWNGRTGGRTAVRAAGTGMAFQLGKFPEDLVLGKMGEARSGCQRGTLSVGVSLCVRIVVSER